MTISKRIGTSWTNSARANSLLLFLSAGFGLGRLPYGREIFGSFFGLLLCFGTRGQSPVFQIVFFLLFTLCSIGLAERAEQIRREKDPDFIILGETCGVWTSFLLLGSPTLPMICTGLLLFHLFNRLKFFPLNVFSSFRGGLGVVLDDFAAGMMINTLLRFFLFLGFLSAGI
ncbi:MAG: phosphatidylglycerophosphatase A [Candidatus Ozemobacteraceae bacterium]